MLNNDVSSSSDRSSLYGKRRGERSFSLLETIVAVSLVAILLVEVSGVHGNAIAFNDYGRKVLQASYLAKRLMSQIEYQASFRSPLKDMAVNETSEKPFEDAPDFSYTVNIEALPHAIDLMFKIFSGGMLGDKDKDSKETSKEEGMGAMLEQIKGMITQSVGDDPIWIAKVEVSWPEGARKASTSLAMIITDTKKLEDSVGKILDTAQVPQQEQQQQGPGAPTSPVQNPPSQGGATNPAAPVNGGGGVRP